MAAKTVRSSASDRPIDIAAIQPKQCVAVEESKMVPIYSNNPDRSTDYWPDSLIERHLVHSPETEVRLASCSTCFRFDLYAESFLVIGGLHDKSRHRG